MGRWIRGYFGKPLGWWRLLSWGVLSPIFLDYTSLSPFCSSIFSIWSGYAVGVEYMVRLDGVKVWYVFDHMTFFLPNANVYFLSSAVGDFSGVPWFGDGGVSLSRPEFCKLLFEERGGATLGLLEINAAVSLVSGIVWISSPSLSWCSCWLRTWFSEVNVA